MKRKILKNQTKKSITRFASYAHIPKTYRELCQLYLPRPIHNDTEDAEATTMMLAMAGFEQLNAEQRDYLEVVTDFVDDYDKRTPIEWPKITALDMLEHLMEARGMSAADLSRVLKTSRNLGAMILRGERKLTLNHVRTLAKHFHVSADLFLL